MDLHAARRFLRKLPGTHDHHKPADPCYARRQEFAGRRRNAGGRRDPGRRRKAVHRRRPPEHRQGDPSGREGGKRRHLEAHPLARRKDGGGATQAACHGRLQRHRPLRLPEVATHPRRSVQGAGAGAAGAESVGSDQLPCPDGQRQARIHAPRAAVRPPDGAGRLEAETARRDGDMGVGISQHLPLRILPAHRRRSGAARHRRIYDRPGQGAKHVRHVRARHRTADRRRQAARIDPALRPGERHRTDLESGDCARQALRREPSGGRAGRRTGVAVLRLLCRQGRDPLRRARAVAVPRE